MNWKWNLSEIVQDKDVSVFSCFSCGGGSTMGYKKAGFRVLGNVELDPAINDIYIYNQHPKYNFRMDLRDFNSIPDNKIPDELKHLDILDGSPPCSTFSMAGAREKGWGKEKQFREGQKLQRLDDLFFVFLKTVEKLNPRIVIAENVKGLTAGKAKGYVNEIIKEFQRLGYNCQIFLLNSAFMDVPQSRERVFFIANRCGFKPLKLNFKGKPIKFGEVRSAKGKEIKSEFLRRILQYMTPDDRAVSEILIRREGKNKLFSSKIVQDHFVCPTITSAGQKIRGFDKSFLSDEDIINVTSFPQDYNFKGQSVEYVCGMSVPPNMMAHIAGEIWRQWLKDDKEKMEK